MICSLKPVLPEDPDPNFRYESLTRWADYLDVSTAKWEACDEFDASYLSAVGERGGQGAGVFGMRLVWESADGLPG